MDTIDHHNLTMCTETNDHGGEEKIVDGVDDGRSQGKGGVGIEQVKD